MNQIITNCYDSHTHFLPTGQIALGLRLDDLKSAEDVQFLKINSEHYRSDWLVGFGWDQNKWNAKQYPTYQQLDLFYSEYPVFFSRIDGHASWLNSKAVLALKNKNFNFKEDFTGVLFEKDHFNALDLLPEFSFEQQKKFALKSQKIFNQAGFTHIRDLSMKLTTWNLLSNMYESKELNLCIDSFVPIKNLNELDSALNEIEQMKRQPNPYLRIQGVKFFADGSLGSKTAFISKNYLSSESNGKLLWNSSDTEELLKKVWSYGLDIAVHTIGDEAVHQIVLIARKLSGQGYLGRLHLEHVELLRPETIQLMKPLHITCYLQPCHWLSDDKWLSDVLPQNLFPFLFQWELLRKNKISFYFGSDSPIEKPSLITSLKSLRLSAEKKVPALTGSALKYFSHPDTNWGHGQTEFSDHEIIKVSFNEKCLFKS